MRCRMLVGECVDIQRHPVDWNRCSMEALGLGEHEAAFLYILLRAKPTVSGKREPSREFRTRRAIWKQILPNSDASARQQSTL